ncbi:fimbrillin family protein [Proteiniphilum sp. UBA1028]|jgi:hypothetical protein|uniref:fimbrillin family protein n=1 Tax=Proteiniphilum sp. UBA1028 TaxID=1947251 RepID=UPI000E9FE086|nr:fimbrillin family protein [Proteiniphilum sp. UBA1028]HBG57136.1 hypothetical protein [Porphyromonadaceae bacterium]
MMNRYLFILPLIGFILSACEGETIDPVRASKSIRLTAEIEKVKTRLSGSTWEKGDVIGVYMTRSGFPLSPSALANNVNYVYDESGTFQPQNESKAIYLPFNGENVDFIGYYPYREDITNFIYPIDLTVQSNQAALDFMYSSNVTARNMTNPNVRMKFSHRLSKIVLQIAHYRNMDLSDLSVILAKVPTKATFNLVDGSLTTSTGTEDIVFNINREGTLAEATVLPGTDLSDSQLWFVIGENKQVYQSSLPEALTMNPLASSTLYNLNITLYTEEEKAHIEPESIIPWITPPSESVTANRTENSPPAIKGSKSHPYTVLQAMEAQGKTGVWVKGYIVGAFDGSINKFVTDTTGQVRTNIALSDNMNETVVSNMIPVNITLAGLKNALNIADNPANLNRLVFIKGDLAAYYSVPGLRETKEYQFID